MKLYARLDHREHVWALGAAAGGAVRESSYAFGQHELSL
jgi:hypothetical protein